MRDDQLDSPDPHGDPTRKTRVRRRIWYCLYFIAIGAVVVLIDDPRFAGKGWIALVFGILGLLGVNVFYDSPEDMRLDGEPHPSHEDVR